MLGEYYSNHITGSSQINLEKLQSLHEVYGGVIQDEIPASLGRVQIQEILDAPPAFSGWWLVPFAFLQSVIICLLAFGGSTLDCVVAGVLGALSKIFQNHVEAGSTTSHTYEYVTALSLDPLLSRQILTRYTESLQDSWCRLLPAD